MAYSFTKSRNSTLLAKYVTRFSTSRSTGRGGAETVRAAFRSRAAPPPSCTPPPLAHPPPLPAPGSTPDPSTSFLHPRSAHAQHSLPRLHLALLAHPSCFHHLLPGLHCPSFCAPSPHAQSPCMRSSTDVWPLTHGPPLPHALLACGTLCAVLPLCTPLSLLHFQHACKRACRHGGALKWRGKRCGLGGGDCHEMGRGEAHHNLGDGGGIAQAEGQMEGWVRIVPPVPPPASEQRVGEGTHPAGSAEAGREQPGQRGLLMNGKGGRMLFPPCLQHACKGGGGCAAGVGCSQGRWGHLLVNGKGGRTLCPPCLQCACKGGGGRAAGVGCSQGRRHHCP